MPGLAELLGAATASRPVITAELPAVDGGGPDAVRAHVTRLAPHVDAINATDNPAAHAHAANLAIAIAVRELGVEPVLQVVCRDKNRLALQADIVGAALHGITSICCLTGDDVTAGDEPEAKRVFDLDAPQLIRTAATLARGSYLSGRPLTPAPPLFIGAVENPAAPPFEYRVRRGLKKAAAGARFLQLQICYRPERLADFAELAERTGLTRKVALLPTICLVRGAQALRFMDANVPGVYVPADLIERVERASDQREAAYRIALEQARHALAQPGVRGLHIADFRRDDTLARLRADLGLPAVRPLPDGSSLAV
ncbi:methylenetetrahydrofolate reductase (NADPH) [Spinactinospora alkalitolerans]|uniref:Methylenetetrahydrofolate reductase n=1 Tax=Spinactinospora alkalitolerans TaxID=687207 RepID=A0A852TUD4_9ACTN|nr:methylenetetrahydrofolate reductase [Spinactinospora alkalitolerans]NYE46482.1 methylenetetrahydrofolate reductase (NADPH) [Spinactinospora alkalitolerans]